MRSEVPILTVPPTTVRPSDIDQAKQAAERAAERAGVRVVDEDDNHRLREISDLLVELWGTSANESPLPAEILRSILHAGCNVTAAYDSRGELWGAATAIVVPGEPWMYSLIAGVRARRADSGVGFALKQHQRAWALSRGLDTMLWTFDPLASRNARFNLTKLGAISGEYKSDFYGHMADGINGSEASDRLVAVWSLTSQRVVNGSEGHGEIVELPHSDFTDIRAIGPDMLPALVAHEDQLWCRVPSDIVELRGRDGDQAASWRPCVRDILTEAFAEGYTATGVTRNGWYRLSREPAE